ncbi:hypothetical protein [Tenacibaculum jejuense]|nr:hypothetical protein [Tenacibaculum jejuense]
MKFKLITLLYFICELCFAQHLKIPEGYKKITNSPASGRMMSTIAFKFDSDSLDDYALVVINKEVFNDVKLLIYVSSLDKQFEVDYINDYDFSIYPIPLTLKKNVLSYGYFLDGTAAFGRFLKLRFNANRNKIQIIGYDSSYRLNDGYVNKSYNLLTGKYIVTKTTHSQEDKTNKQYFNGKKQIEKLFIDDINNKLFEQLDNTGKEFEK